MSEHAPIVTLRSKRLYLRPIIRTDIPQMLIWMNDPLVKRFLAMPYPVTEIMEDSWFERISTGNDNFVFAVVVSEKEEDTYIGNMSINSINWVNRTASTGAVIGNKEFWGKGHGTEAKMLLLQYAFQTLNIRRMESSVIAYNKRSRAYMAKCGYQQEGIRRRAFYKDGGYHDEILYGLFQNEWDPFWDEYKRKYYLT